ncbi:MAG: class E sortase [Actinobacteria bacterium]|nr:class E sortase [Actinomycetota bacterium]
MPSSHQGRHHHHHRGRHRRHRSRKAHPTAALILRIVAGISLAAAVALSGYVAYHMWYTNVQAGRAQGRLEAQFAQRVQAAAPVAATYDPQAFDLAPLVVPRELDTAAGLDSGLFHPNELIAREVIVETAPGLGEPIGTIAIPKIGVEWVVVEGDRLADLALGAVHIPSTPLPGQPGNAVISGHRTTHGAPFNRLDELLPDDTVSVTTTIGTHTYQVIESRVVRPTDTWVMDQWRGAWLTLTTCHPEFRATERWVVFTRLVVGPNAAAILNLPSPT